MIESFSMNILASGWVGCLSPGEGRIARCIGLIEGVMGTVPRMSGQ